MTDGGVLHYFPSKVHLLLAVARSHSEMKAAGWPATTQPPTFFEIQGQAWRSKCRAQEEPGWVDFSVAATAEATNPFSPIHSEHSALYADIVVAVAARYRQCKERGELRADVDPDALARVSLALATGMSTQWVLEDRSYDMCADYLEALSWLSASVTSERMTPDEAGRRIVAAAGKITTIAPSG